MGIDFPGISIGVGNSWPINYIASGRKSHLTDRYWFFKAAAMNYKVRSLKRQKFIIL